MKKILERLGAGMLAFCLVLLTAGCQSQAPSQAADKTPVAEETKEKPEESSLDREEEEVSAEETETDSEIAEEEMTDSSNEKDIPVLSDCIGEKIGAFAGCAVTLFEISDPKVFDIMTTHFNAVTIGNELKPDCLFGYSNNECPGTIQEELDGKVISVPVMDYSRAEQILDKIYEWNSSNPDRFIKVRGHVLLWHSQTPEWFFHEDYDADMPYVDKDTMNVRLEWYIKTVLTHFTGPDSKYKDMFYGWDVVNEAISDSTGTYRTDAEKPDEPLSNATHGSNSSWWHVYESNEFIINAFIFANKYAPENLELYYNDYNECDVKKRNGIIDLLEAVKAKEGAPGEGTRISGFGMQGHYMMDTPSSNEVEASIKAYSKVVDSVQITELDIRASQEYDGTEETIEAENEKLRKRYNMLYFGIQAAQNTEGVNVTGITWWGTVDHYSWLQTASFVGGGNTTNLPQCPLLFDSDYEPKPCFFVFAKEE